MKKHAAANSLSLGCIGKDILMRSMRPPEAPPAAMKPIVRSSSIMSARLTIRKDEAARRKLADTDGTVRRERQIAERNRLI